MVLGILLLFAMLPGQARADGPPTLRVTSNTTLSADFAGEVVIAKDLVTLDCAGHRIIGNGNGRGVLVDSRTNVTVKNCDVSNFVTGFLVTDTFQSTFENNRSHDNNLANPNQTPGWISGAGFWMQSSSGNSVRDNRIHDNPSDGLDVLNSPNNLFEGNSVDRNLAGFFVFGKKSTGNALQGNTATLNGYAGFTLAEGASDNTLSGNTATGNPVAGFLIDGTDVVNNLLMNNTADANENGFAVVNGATANLLTSNAAHSNTLRGFAVAFGASSNSIERNTATGNGNGCSTCGGFIVASASMNALVGNDSNDNLGYGFVLFSATANTLSENAACGNSILDALQDAASTGNVWTDNTFCTSEGI